MLVPCQLSGLLQHVEFLPHLTLSCVTLQDARVEVEKIIGRGSGFVAVEIPFTPRAKRVLELSLEEARQLGERTHHAHLRPSSASLFCGTPS
jgi:hypothetical protein